MTDYHCNNFNIPAANPHINNKSPFHCLKFYIFPDFKDTDVFKILPFVIVFCYPRNTTHLAPRAGTRSLHPPTPM